MAAITEYDQESLASINPEDILLGTTIDPLDSGNNETRNFSIQTLVSYLTNGSTGTLITTPNGIPLASTSQQGLLGVDDKTKLDNIGFNTDRTGLGVVNLDQTRTATQITTEISAAITPANLPIATTTTNGVVNAGTGLSIDATGDLTVNAATVPTLNQDTTGNAATATAALGVRVTDRNHTTETACTAAGGTWTGTVCHRVLQVELIPQGGTPSGDGWITFENEI